MNDLNLQKKDFKIYKCPEHINKNILSSIKTKKSLIRIKYILIPSLLLIGIFFILQNNTSYNTELNNNDQQEIDMVLQLFQDSITEAQNI